MVWRTPILHHQALGIHRGAYVQDTAPLTADLQDGVLWVDTSTGPPYQLKCWMQAFGRWDEIGSVGGTSGGTPDPTIVYAQPTEPPTASAPPAIVWVDTSDVPPYIMKYWWPDFGLWVPIQCDRTGYPLPDGSRLEFHSRAGDAVTTTVQSGTSDKALLVTQDAYAFPSYPAGWRGASFDDSAWPNALVPSWASGTTIWYQDPIVDLVGDLYDDVLFRHTFTLPPGIVTAAHIDLTYDKQLAQCGVNNSGVIPFGTIVGPGSISVDIPTNYLNPGGRNVLFVEVERSFDFTPGLQYTLTVTVTPADILRLLHGQTNEVCWDTDSTTMTIYKDGTAVVKTPLPEIDISANPTEMAVKDPLTNLLSYYPVTSVVSPKQLLTPPPATSAIPDCDQARCGVAVALEGHLESLFSQWSHWLAPLVTVGSTLLTGAILAATLDPFFDLAALIDAKIVWQEIRSTVLTLTGSEIGSMLHALTPDQITEVQRLIYCQLICSDGAVVPSATQIQAWEHGVYSDVTLGLNVLQNALLVALLQFTPLQDWQIVASRAAPSTACASWTCP